MIERHLHALHVEVSGQEAIAATRERLQRCFPPGAARRMTQLGMLIGSVLEKIDLGEDDAIFYASSYGENRTLEDYLASFPAASPTLFQTSIHPSAVQQAMIARGQAVRQFFPMTGDRHLAGQALHQALLAPQARVILCGGEERGTWLREHGVASEETFAFAAALSTERTGALASFRLEGGGSGEGSLTLCEFFSALRLREPLRREAAPGLVLTLSWH